VSESAGANAALAQLLDAISTEAAKVAGKPVTLVSVTFDWLEDGAGAFTPEVEITRATRTLVFSRGKLMSGGRGVVAATAVHKV
jgi:hypothetical protein